MAKLSKCRSCGKEFEKQRAFQVCCCPKCGIEYVNAQKAKKLQKAQAEKRKQERLARVALKNKLETVRDLLPKAQAEFNRFIRLRDKQKPCISCGRALKNGIYGGGFDAGHYRSIGSAAHLRFDENNVHGQCVYCNRHLSGNHVEYRRGLIERIGLAEVERLEADNTLRKWDKEELRELIRVYKQKCKDLCDE